MKRLLSKATLLCCLALSAFAPGFAQTTGEITKGNCDACVTSCQKTLDYCAQKKGRYEQATMLNALNDCITACKMTSEFLSRGSAFQKKSATLCVETCNTCAKSCDAFKDDNNMKACADECRKTAGNCHKIASAP